jgi:hypothetical protein
MANIDTMKRADALNLPLALSSEAVTLKSTHETVLVFRLQASSPVRPLTFSIS